MPVVPAYKLPLRDAAVHIERHRAGRTVCFFWISETSDAMEFMGRSVREQFGSERADESTAGREDSRGRRGKLVATAPKKPTAQNRRCGYRAMISWNGMHSCLEKGVNEPLFLVEDACELFLFLGALGSPENLRSIASCLQAAAIG